MRKSYTDHIVRILNNNPSLAEELACILTENLAREGYAPDTDPMVLYEDEVSVSDWIYDWLRDQIAPVLTAENPLGQFFLSDFERALECTDAISMAMDEILRRVDTKTIFEQVMGL